MCWGVWEQSSWASVWRRLCYDVALISCHADHPHTHNSRYPHHPVGPHQSYTHRTQRPPTMSCSPASGRYIGPSTATSNTLGNIQTDASLTSLPGPPTHMPTLGWREEKRRKPLARQWDHFSNESTWHYSSEASVYYTRKLLSSPSMAMQSRPAYYTRVCIVRKIIW